MQNPAVRFAPKTLPAEAIDTFSKKNTRRDEHDFKKPFLGMIENIYDSGPNPAKYPDVRFLDPADFWSDFNRFLKTSEKMKTRSDRISRIGLLSKTH